ncbi:MAG: ABC transporter permease, partial [Treponemataceae bacterium]
MKVELFDPDHWEDIFSHIKKHKVRTILTAFGVFWGIFLLLILLAVGSGLEKGTYRRFGRVGVNSIHVWTGRTSLAYRGNRPGRFINLYDGDTDAIRERVSGLKEVCPRLSISWSTTTRYDKKNGSFRINGEVPGIANIEPIVIAKGRFINERDALLSRKTAVIGLRVAEILFSPGQDPVGEYIEIGGTAFQ